MRSFFSPFAASAALAILFLSPIAASAEPPVICAAETDAPPAKLIASCTALINNPATTDSDRLDARITRAGALDDSGQTAKALAEIDGIIAKEPNLARAFRARGEILRVSGKTEAAFAALNQAIKLDPSNATGYEDRGNVFNGAGKYDRAIEDYNEALRLKPDYAQAFSDRGAAWYFKGEYRNAIADYDEAIRLEPNLAAPTPTAVRPGASSAAATARSMTPPRRFGSIRRSRSSSTIAGWTSPAMATTRERSPITTRR
jgi:tetratricopeptide (TPR) repeat protein